MKSFAKIIVLLISFLLISCSDDTTQSNAPSSPRTYKYLALGDSYTIGESVCENCRFPAQLRDSLGKYLNIEDRFQLKIIAQTGWTTSHLKTAITTENPEAEFDLVTLLIGVNNQYQNELFALYEQEFPELLTEAIRLAKGNKENVIVVSIPDYAFTPFGNENTTISTAIDNYNAFAKNYAESSGVAFINITDITRLGLQNPSLVASDGLHPSEVAYTKFVERILPKALTAITN